MEQSEKIEQLEQRLKDLEVTSNNLQEKVNRNSENSHIPPSSDLVKSQTKKPKKKRRKKRGGQPGHQGHSRILYPVEECTSVHDYLPKTCSSCGEELFGFDTFPHRHQVVEIPPIQLQIEEHRLHQLSCGRRRRSFAEHCGEKTRAELPLDVEKSGYGARVVGLVSVKRVVYRYSHRMIVSAMSDFFGVSKSRGSVNRLRTEASAALLAAVEEAKAYIQSAPTICADETGFKQGNNDGKNPENRKAWLWVAVTQGVSFFQVMLSRSTEAALRGRDLLAQEKKLFRLWRKVRDRTKGRKDFQSLVIPIRERLFEIISNGADYQIGSKEKTPRAKTVRTCRQLLKVEPALWLFVEIEGLDPTNNAAERAIRPAVLWKRISFGSQSEAGSIFVARMLTVVTSLRSQNRNVLEFMIEAIRASRQGNHPPSLIPTHQSGSDSDDESTLLAA